jgi:hypothetical protein
MKLKSHHLVNTLKPTKRSIREVRRRTNATGHFNIF